ncbi:unnamed protein product [Caenorhabditis auriculariae]|uniref:Kinesin motor domain-containing protein n=1 Tax=Caenorhabditis auriculariae TaxID=2777116 RepID=A0A8S1GX66_9PELO|nr:unnamed protein product [Caenorhabditis auriculariae]
MVVVRIRPLNAEEKARKNFQCVFPLDRKRVLLVDPEKFENNILRQNRQHEKKFEFDATFGPNSTQEDVHQSTTGPIIDSVIQGYNATVFAYGATGSGKTYTMIGTKDRPGLMTLMTKTLYEKLDHQFNVNLSYLEIYNEVIRDLLNPNGSDLDLLEDEKGNIRVPGLSSVKAPNLSREWESRSVADRGDEGQSDVLEESRAAPGTGNLSTHPMSRISGGNTRTAMIAHVTPSSANFEESYNTLTYASRANNITNKLVKNRPASADQVYSEALVRLRKEYNSQPLKNSSSTNALTSKQSTAQERQQPSRLTNKSNDSNKQQYIALGEKQQKLREKLMDVNQEAYAMEMSIMSKSAIINAWEKYNQGDKPAESIELLKADSNVLSTRVAVLRESRTKIERALRKGAETASSLESRMRALAATNEQQDVVRLLVRMSAIEAEKTAALNDLAIQGLIMEKKDTSISKLQKYELVADRLIDGKLEGNDRKKLEEEYRVIKNQFHYHLLPLKNVQSGASWNSLLLPKIQGNEERNGTKRAKKRDSVQLPLIPSGSKPFLSSSDSYDDSCGERYPEIDVRLPEI